MPIIIYIIIYLNKTKAFIKINKAFNFIIY